MTERATAIASKVEAFVGNEVIPCQKVSRLTFHARKTHSSGSCAQRRARRVS